MAFRVCPVDNGAHALRLLRTVNKHDLVVALAKRLGMVEHRAEVCVDSVLALLGDAMVRGETITLIGLGRFTSRLHRARSIHRIRDRQRIDIPARLKPHFAPSPTLVRQANVRANGTPRPSLPTQPDLFGDCD